MEELKNSNQRLSENDGKLNDEIKNLKKEIEDLKTAEDTVIVQQVRYISDTFSSCCIFQKIKFFICLITEISCFQENNGLISWKFKLRRNKKTVGKNWYFVTKLRF